MNFSIFRLVCVAGLSVFALSVRAQEKVPEDKPEKYASPPSKLIEQLGGEIGISAIVEASYRHILEDNRINRFFLGHGDLEHQKAMTKQLIYSLLAGPAGRNLYEGMSMSAAHGNLGVTVAQFDAFLEDVYLGFADCRTPYRVANRVIAVLLPLRRQIVTK